MTELAAGKAPTVARLQDKRARLLASGERIDTIVAATTAELHECEAQIEELRSATDGVLQALAGRSEMVIDVDEVINATNPLHAQIFRLVAEDSAIEDTMYQLSIALQREDVDAVGCLKSLRALAREQFVVRAHLNRAREIAAV